MRPLNEGVAASLSGAEERARGEAGAAGFGNFDGTAEVDDVRVNGRAGAALDAGREVDDDAGAFPVILNAIQISLLSSYLR